MLSIFTILYNEVLYRPLFNGLVFLYNLLPGQDFGIAIIVLTIVIRLLMYPLFQKSIKSQKELAALQPKLKEIQKKYSKDKEKQAQAVMELYKQHKINPMSGCLPLLIQLPILIAFFQVLRTGLDPQRLNGLYSFVANPGVINPIFLGVIDLSGRSAVLAVLAGIAQFIQTKMSAPQAPATKTGPEKFDFTKMMSNQMLYLMPLFTVIIGLQLPAGLPLYFFVSTLFGIIQQYLTTRDKSLEPATTFANKEQS